MSALDLKLEENKRLIANYLVIFPIKLCISFNNVSAGILEKPTGFL